MLQYMLQHAAPWQGLFAFLGIASYSQPGCAQDLLVVRRPWDQTRDPTMAPIMDQPRDQTRTRAQSTKPSPGPGA